VVHYSNRSLFFQLGKWIRVSKPESWGFVVNSGMRYSVLLHVYQIS
jgi:hypothetical protein